MKTSLPLHPPQGAELTGSGVRYRVWAPQAEAVDALVWTGEEPAREVPLALDASGYYHGIDARGQAGDLYRFRLDGGADYPDPASRWQPEGVHGRSMVIDPRAYEWKDGGWSPPSVRDLVIYELHLGTFSPEGTFLGAIPKLPHLVRLGVSAIEIMPVADFAGWRNWGYDGVCLYAPAGAYGTPDEMRALVDAAHGQGLAVILDVVYNHLGPEGNYYGVFAPGYLNEERKTPWGGALRYEEPAYRPVRAFFVANPLYWRTEFHVDGFRLDATHTIMDESERHVLEEMTAAIHDAGGFAIAEDPRNQARVITPAAQGGLGFDAVWADDFHQSLRVCATGEQARILGDFKGTLEELVDTLRAGWHYRGKFSRHVGANRGTDCRHLPPWKFVHCISNHDQVGDRPGGQRLNHLVGREQYLAVSALLCLTPYTPMLFMGQEWAASTPFLFFTDFEEELGRLVTEGRAKQLAEFTELAAVPTPDPREMKAFEDSKLVWDELRDEKKSQCLELYRQCLELRRREPAFRPMSRECWHVTVLEMGAGALRLEGETGDYLLLFDIAGGHSGTVAGEWICKAGGPEGWKVVLSTAEKRFGGSGESAYRPGSPELKFTEPELVVLRS